MADNAQETKDMIFKLLDEMKVNYSRREETRIDCIILKYKGYQEFWYP